MIFNGCRIEEVPVKLTTRIYGESKLDNKKEIVNHIRMLSRVAKWKVVGR